MNIESETNSEITLPSLPERRQKVFDFLAANDIRYEIIEHPETPTIELARQYWPTDRPIQHCKNLFFRNHKGNRHYLVIMDSERTLDVRRLSALLGERPLSFASPERMMRYLGVAPGSVSVFGLLNDTANSVSVVLDTKLQNDLDISFHPNDNTASLIISHDDFMKTLRLSGNRFKFLPLG